MRQIPTKVETVNAATGKVEKVETVNMGLMPPRSGLCSVCAVDHQPDMPHNCQSLYYQYAFFGAHKRWPTWADAIAHCDQPAQAVWKAELVLRQVWKEPPDGAPPIAMAYERQP